MKSNERSKMIPATHNGHGTTSDDFLRAGHGLALSRVKRASKRRTNAQSEWHDAIRDAVELGVSLRKVGEAAGITHVRVLQLTRS